MAADASTSSTPARAHHDHSITETLISLIVAFVLAMTFRGFVIEGFVIPTGSMAPTLMGQHALLHSPHTGYEFPIGLGGPRLRDTAVADPMLGYHPEHLESIGVGRVADLSLVRDSTGRPRMGDRILVLKSFFPFMDPDRFDVVVFKNPTSPNGEAGNYIKRLIGLPGETVWLADGDVFVRRGPGEPFEVQRKPTHVQRAVWQPVHDMDLVPVRPDDLPLRRWEGPPWSGTGWTVEDDRTLRSSGATPGALQWDDDTHPIDDWTSYNMVHGGSGERYAVSDLRVRGTIVPDADGLETTLGLVARGFRFTFSLGGGEASIGMEPATDTAARVSDQVKRVTAEAPAFRAGRPTNVEFVHVDQALHVRVDGEEVVRLEYDWSPEQRLRLATGSAPQEPVDRIADRLTLGRIKPLTEPAIDWTFAGSPVRLHRVRLDRDLYYRPARLSDAGSRNAGMTDADGRPLRAGFGTHPDHLAELGSNHFLMLGDNSAASLDSRLWGNPAPAVAEQIDDTPFVVPRRMLIGKAWVVYFPSPHAFSHGGRALIPDFGRLRFIR